MNDRPVLPADDRAARAAAARPGLLVLDDNARVAQWFGDHFGGTYEVFAAASIAKAFDILSHYEIAIIVAGEAVADESTLDLLRAVRLEAPAVMTIVLSASEDSEGVLRLINQVGVCRVLFKPVRTSAADAALKAALALHVRMRARPATLRMDRADVPGEGAAAAKPTALARLRGWLARARPPGTPAR